MKDHRGHSGGIEWAIRDMFFPRFRAASHLEDVVFDVFLLHRRRGNMNEWNPKLLEINPFFEMTDPCLFSWDNEGRDFDGTFRYVQ